MKHLDQNKIWQHLCQRQLTLLETHGCELFWAGFDQLNLNLEQIPHPIELNAKITPATGWKVVQTTVRYSTADQWYPQFARKHFPITTYLRTAEELDFTPEPDMFHDIFGHLAFFMLPQFTAFAELFAPAYLAAPNQEIRENIKRLAWFSYEFGVLIEHNQPKAFGAGLISSFGELHKVISGQTKLVPFTLENVLSHDKAIWSMHDTLFCFNSLAEVTHIINSYLKTLQLEVK